MGNKARPKQKKGPVVSRYMTRTQAIRKLQLKISDFRKLCIVKGIHPREPKKKVSGRDKTYYHTKDILLLSKEPVLGSLRAKHAHAKKVKKAKGKSAWSLVKSLSAAAPGYSLDHIVKERYPTFTTALRDLDDAVTLIHLFAVLPAESSRVAQIPRAIVDASRALSLQWQGYVVRSRALRKVFVTVKAVYYQAEIQGQQVTWQVPHALSQILPGDVDFKVMLSFVEFHHTLLKFILYKLYHTLQLHYPPVLDIALVNHGASLPAIISALSCPPPTGPTSQLAATDAPPPRAPLKNDPATSATARECGDVFKECVVFIGRECPLEMLMFVVSAFGGVVGWQGEGSPIPEDDVSITHQVCDRPKIPQPRTGRTYVQPQWVLDAANFRVLPPVDKYRVGEKLPPHLSPFEGAGGGEDDDDYVPDYLVFMQELYRAAARARGDEEAGMGGGEEDGEGGQGEEEQEEEREERERSEAERAYQQGLAEELGVEVGGGGAGGRVRRGGRRRRCWGT